MDKERNAAEETVSSDGENALPKKKNRFIWSLLSIVIAAATIWAVMAQSKSFSFQKLFEELGHAHFGWILSAVASMIMYISLEAMALLCILREFGYKLSFRRGFVYSSADIYFSAITPSATGGQPASAFFMRHDGVPTTLAAVVLLANLMMYTCSTVGVGILSTAVAPKTFIRFGTFSQILVVIGFMMQLALLFLIILLIFKEKIILSVGNGFLTFLGKIKIVKDVDGKKEKFTKSMNEYREHATALKGKRKMLFKVFLLNMAQRIAQLLVTVFTYLALGNPLHALRAFSLQAYVSIGAYCIPIPGAMGITDYMMIDGFSRIEDVPQIMTESRTLTFELLSRTLSFYSCIFICGLTVLISYLIYKKRRSEQ